MPDVSELTIVIPTRNRPILIKNQLRYYARLKLTYDLVYIDASDENIHQENIHSLGNFQDTLRCTILRANPNDLQNPARRINEQIRDYLDEVRTKYVCQSGDDDLFIPSGLDTAVENLEQDPELSACGGYCIQANTRNDHRPEQEKGTASITHFTMANLIMEDPYVRVRNFIAHFANVSFAVKRLSVWKDCYTAFSEEGMESGLIELLMSSVVLAQGTVKRADDLLLMRHYHHRNDDIGREDHSYDLFDPEFSNRVDRFRLEIGRLFNKYSVPIPENWDVEILQAVQNMALNSASQQVNKSIRNWGEHTLAPRETAWNIASTYCSENVLKLLIGTINENTVHGLRDPSTRSFSLDGLT
jgi:glycosyltransferase domain-containing protein